VKGGIVNQTLVVVARDEILRRIRSEFLEMPGLCLTHAQAQRLWGLDAPTCASVLASLTGERFLYLRTNGTYGRLSDCCAVLTPAPRNFPRAAAKKFMAGA
jgi:hypothetical protein